MLLITFHIHVPITIFFRNLDKVTRLQGQQFIQLVSSKMADE